MLKISIPKPCHEDWEAMHPVANGRHCSACVKTVTDFTTMTDDEIRYFFINKTHEQQCGRFTTEQLNRITIDLPGSILYLRMPLWKKFLVACLIVFSTSLFSCNINIKGNQVINQELRTANSELLYSSTPYYGYVGGITSTIDSTFTTYEDSSTPGTSSLKRMPVTPATPDLAVTNVVADYNHINTVPLININEQNTKNAQNTDSIDCNKEIFY